MYYEILSDMEQCLLCIVIMFLAFVTLHRMLQTIWFHMPVKYILFSVCVFGISLIYFEGACVVIEHISDPVKEGWMAQVFMNTPVPLQVLFIVILLGTDIIFKRIIRRTRQHQLSYDCVKECMDALPEGILFTYENGTPILVNETMQRLNEAFTGNGIINGNQFWDIVSQHPDRKEDKRPDKENIFVVEAMDRIWDIQQQRIYVAQQPITEIIATDVTGLYNLHLELNRRNAVLADINKRLQHFNQNVTAVTREQEILAAKIRVHNNLGRTLLAFRTYLATPPLQRNRQELLEIWQETFHILEKDVENHHTIDMKDIYETAHLLGVKILLNGELPDCTEILSLIITATKECLTNTVKHAKGTVLYLDIQTVTQHGIPYYQIQLQNNGTPPLTNDITEHGGLRNLRRLIEAEGGTMLVKGKPCFQLTILLRQNKEKMDENKSDDS